MPAKRGRYGTTSSSSNQKKPKVKNLEVRIHKYEVCAGALIPEIKLFQDSDQARLDMPSQNYWSS